MHVPDCQLKEYGKEIQNRYDITVSESRLSTILKNLSFSRKKGWILRGFLTVVGKGSIAKVPGASRCLVSQADGLECWASHLSWWIGGQCTLRGKNTWMVTKRTDYSQENRIQKAWELQRTASDVCQWISRMLCVWGSSQRRYIRGICWRETLTALQCFSWFKVGNCDGQCFHTSFRGTVFLFLDAHNRIWGISLKIKAVDSNSFLHTHQTTIPSNTRSHVWNRSSVMENTTLILKKMTYSRKR